MDVLLVEDNRDAATSMATLLELHGHAVRVARTGQEGLRAAAEQMPDAAILDIGLPVLDGWQLAGRIRAMRPHDPPLLIAMSGYGTQADRARSRGAGFDHHLVKPVDCDRLVGLLRDHDSRVV